MVLYDDNGFFAKGIPDDTFAKLKDLAENGAVLRWVAFTPSDGFVILADKSGFFARCLPAAAALRLKTASDNGEDLKSMTFVGKNGWVLIWDGGFAAEGLPRDLFQQLQKLSTAGRISRASPSRRAAAGPCCSIATVPLTATSPTPRSPRSTSCKGSAAFASPASPSRPTPITAGCCSWIRVRPGVSSFSRDPKGSAGDDALPFGSRLNGELEFKMTAAVHVLCGPARTGKTRRMIERYRVCLADTPGGALWIGPTVRAVEALRERLLAETAALCCPRLCTFQDVVQEIVRINDPEARPLTAAQRRLLAEDVIAELSGGGRLAHFADVADARGFTDGVLGLLTDLQRNAVPPEDFARRAGAGDKQRQCAQLYAHYQGELQRQNLHDSDGTAGRACDLLRRGLRRPFDEVRAVFVDGFSDFTRPQHEFLELLCRWVEELWVALPGEADGQRADLFARPRETLERLRRLVSGGRQPPDSTSSQRPSAGISGLTPPARPAGLLHLERQLFRPIRAVEQSADPAGVSLIEAPGVLGEARLVVRRIKRLLLDGAAADDILVVVRDVSPYADVLTEVFDEYGVPVEVDGVEPLTRNPAAALLLRAARLLDDDWPFAGVTALLRNTYFRPRWPEADGPDLPQRPRRCCDCWPSRAAATPFCRRCGAGRNSSNRGWRTNRPRNRGGGAPTSWRKSAASSFVAFSRRGTTLRRQRRWWNTRPGCTASPRTWA